MYRLLVETLFRLFPTLNDSYICTIVEYTSPGNFNWIKGYCWIEIQPSRNLMYHYIYRNEIPHIYAISREVRNYGILATLNQVVDYYREKYSIRTLWDVHHESQCVIRLFVSINGRFMTCTATRDYVYISHGLGPITNSIRWRNVSILNFVNDYERIYSIKALRAIQRACAPRGG